MKDSVPTKYNMPGQGSYSSQVHDRSKWPSVPGSLERYGKTKMQIFVKNLRYFDANVLFFLVENLRYFELTRMCFFEDKTCHFNANVLLGT